MQNSSGDDKIRQNVNEYRFMQQQVLLASSSVYQTDKKLNFN